MTNSHFEILLVCNGDNARSPLAAACMSRLVNPDPFGVEWTIASAGTEAEAGTGVRLETLRAASDLGLDLSDHEVRQLEPGDCDAPDLVLAMSWEQVSHIWSVVPEAWEKVFTVKEFVHWATRSPSRPPILFPDRAELMRDRIQQTHAVRKRARADHGFWGGIRPQDLNLIEPVGKGDEAWTAMAKAVTALMGDVVTLLRGPEVIEAKPLPKAVTKAPVKSPAKKAPAKKAHAAKPKTASKPKAKARR